MRAERGTAALLLPACVLLILVLGGLTVDYAHAFLAQRDLANAVASAANDAAGTIDASRFYGSGAVVIDGERAAAVAADALAARLGTVAHITAWDVAVIDGDRVQVGATGEIDRIFGRALPGGAARIAVHARATAQAVRG